MCSTWAHQKGQFSRPLSYHLRRPPSSRSAILGAPLPAYFGQICCPSRSHAGAPKERDWRPHSARQSSRVIRFYSLSLSSIQNGRPNSARRAGQLSERRARNSDSCSMHSLYRTSGRLWQLRVVANCINLSPSSPLFKVFHNGEKIRRKLHSKQVDKLGRQSLWGNFQFCSPLFADFSKISKIKPFQPVFHPQSQRLSFMENLKFCHSKAAPLELVSGELEPVSH